MFFLGLQYSENFFNTGASFISLPELSKLKVEQISQTICPLQVNKTEVLTLLFFPSFQWQMRKNSKYFSRSLQYSEKFPSNENDSGGFNFMT